MMKKFFAFCLSFVVILFTFLVSNLYSVRVTKDGEKNWTKSGSIFEGVVSDIYTNTKFTNRIIMGDSLNQKIEFSTNNMGIKIGDTIQILSRRSLDGLYIFPSGEILEIKR